MPRRVLEGIVVQNRSNKTASVLVERKVMHPLYKKYVKRSKKYAIHDPKNSCELGAKVRFIECRPLSKTKTWELLENN